MAVIISTFLLYLILHTASFHVISQTKRFPTRYPILVRKQQVNSNSLNHTSDVTDHAKRDYLTENKFNVEHLNAESYVFSAHTLPSDPRLWPSIGNGHIATVVHSPYILMNGLYNGRGNKSHRAAIPSPVSVNVTSLAPARSFNMTYTLDTRLVNEFAQGFTGSAQVKLGGLDLGGSPAGDAAECEHGAKADVYIDISGVFEETLISEDGFQMTLLWYAHRSIESLIVLEVKVIRVNSEVPLKINLDVDQFRSSEDLIFQNISMKFKNVSYRYGETIESETSWSGKQHVHLLFDTIPNVFVLDIDEKVKQWTFFCALHARKRTAFAAYIKGTKLRTDGRLLSTHIRSWINTWNKGRIDIKGNVSISRAAVASYYYILSSVPLRSSKRWPFIGLSPSGLAWGDSENYFGHVFWDQETWMYPPILMLHSDIADTLLSTRARTLLTARKNANETGYRGARYPWESAVTGTETTESDICASMEIHINADISFAILQYWRANGDEEMLKRRRYVDVALGIADFWISRVTFNSTMKKYEILGVQPPDEYSVNVSNSAFTNSAASLSLMLAARLSKLLGREKWNKYDNYAKSIYIPFDDALRYHPEYSGYVNGTLVKQADIILMGFPLMWSMSNQVRLNDLQIYEPVSAQASTCCKLLENNSNNNFTLASIPSRSAAAGTTTYIVLAKIFSIFEDTQVTSTNGPAMSDSMFAIGWLELKKYKRAVTSFTKMFQHVSPDFQVWTESKGGAGATNFITGMGGYLQAILFGFGGFRLRDDRLDVDPILPPGCSEMNFTGIDYLGCSLNIAVNNQSITVTLTMESKKRQLEIYDGTQRQRLVLNKSIQLRAGKPAIIKQVLNETSLHVQ